MENNNNKKFDDNNNEKIPESEKQNLETMLKSIADNTDINQLINQFSSSLNSFENEQENENNLTDETEEEYSDYDDNVLDKYLVNNHGKSICDILTDISLELKELNKNLSEKK
tara:strand:- start:35 stop:373 length:339 start_codon:yes stop_codon:yes gene_type:complete